MNAGQVRQLTKNGSTQSRHAKCEPEKESRDHSHPPRNQLLPVDDNCRESRSQNQADQHAQNFGPKEVGVGQRQRER